ncbi:MAG TPA: peptidoglycan-binding protein [Nitrospira sp.]|nr:peptidoglycan-binding protein [Nitrospira sp.]HNI68161.1 peptidoglycan-binding protein [Nitrospira sp.]
MKTLQVGDAGQPVKRLQRKLLSLGFPPGTIDGEFGYGTEAAVLAFQRSNGLLADGIAGPRTLTALGLSDDDSLPTAIPLFTITVVSQMFPVTPMRNIKTNLPPVLNALVQAELVDSPMVLTALATIRAETESFEPIAEYPSRFNSSPNGHLFDLYDHRTDLGNQGPPDGERFRGRGYIQLTGRFNYGKYGAAIGLGSSLVTKPDQASDPQIAARLLAAFLKDKERPIKEALLGDDLAAARRLVNGGAHGLERFREAYTTGLQSIS